MTSSVTSSSIPAPTGPALSVTSDLAQLSQPSRTSITRTRDAFAEMAQQEKALQTDGKYRKYAASVDKTLQSFDQVNEWADFITFLAKLLKCLQGYPQFPAIPHKLIVAKRLSQCLNPALPTGVHQRALDVYTHILTTIGPENLRCDLPAWSSGLFPFFQYAATSVKPILLNIYERFYLPLQESLRPATKAFILALLPGLEEETGEWFDKVSALLDRLSGTVSPAFFFQNVWLVLITAPASRIPALNYLARRLPKMKDNEGTGPQGCTFWKLQRPNLRVLAGLGDVVGQDVGLMVRGFAAALGDTQILVQRGILDLMTTTLRLESTGFKGTRRADQILLFRAVIGVVLRRDLSLSRRLYTWLLGSQDASEAQVQYLGTNGLDLLRAALKADMDVPFSPNSQQERERQRPFKIFISLLDKWEIGAQLTEVLVLDAFGSLRRSLVEAHDHDELLMTSNMLFDILDPFLMWKQVYIAVKAELEPDTATSVAKAQSIDLARFIVKTFRLHDEEVQRLHAPITAFALLDVVEKRASASTASRLPEQLAAAVDLAVDLLHEVPSRFFDPPSSAVPEPVPAHLGLSLADALYGAKDVKAASLPETDGRELLTGGLSSVLHVLQASARRLASPRQEDHEASRAIFRSAATALHLLLDLISPPEAANTAAPLLPDWSPDGWMNALTECLAAYPASVANFGLHCSVIRTILKMSSQGTTMRPNLETTKRSCMEILASKLLDYLQAGTAPCYLEAVQLLWSVEAVAPQRGYIETMLSARLASSSTAVRLDTFEAFGTLWRFTEDGQLPGVILRNPMFTMLDSLKSEDLPIRRAAEAWMRCSLKSYIRILDPLLGVLLDPFIALTPSISKIAGIRVPVLSYGAPFDQSRVHHVLDNLLALARFGGQGFIRIAKSSFLKHTLDPALRERVIAADLETHTYLDGIVVLLLRFLRANPDERLGTAFVSTNAHIHSVAAELLQVLISRGEAELLGLAAVEVSLTSRLFQSVHRGELDLQNKLLHVLHSVILATSSSNRRRKTSSSDHAVEEQPPDLTHDEFLVRVISDAVSQKSNAVIHHWIDFLLMTIPQFRHQLHTLILPLIDRLSSRLAAFLQDFEAAYSPTSLTSTSSSDTDAEFTALANALERLMLVATAETLMTGNDVEVRSVDRAASDVAPTVNAGGGGSGGLLGYMTGVLSHSEAEPADVPEEVKIKHEVLHRVREVVKLLLSAWNVMSRLEADADSDQASSQEHFALRAKVRARRALERIHKAAPTEVLFTVVDFWHVKCRVALDAAAEARLFSILQVLAPSPQTVVASLCEKLNHKQSLVKHRLAHAATDAVAFEFFEAYILQLDGAMSVQVWGTTLGFAREVLNSASIKRAPVYPTLRCFNALAEKVSQTSALEDRRLRRDLQETFTRLCDSTVQLAGRAAESGSWLRKSLPESSTSNGETASVASEKVTDGKLAVVEAEQQSSKPERPVVREIIDFLSARILGNFRRFLIDFDKTVATCSNMVYYIVTPAFKTRAKTFDADPSIFALLHEMASNPQIVKAWRSVVSDAFSDNRFFSAPPFMHARWKPLIKALFASDKEKLNELIAKISTASSANIFTNRELESLSRALSLRRLTYTLFTGEKDRYLAQLPVIQEKLVDLLRSSVGDMVHAEVYLCLRVLFCRIGNQHLAGLWPVILTELLRLFDSLLDVAVPDDSDLLRLVFSACKFLDLTLVLQTEEFQIHEWMFVTDTVDAIYPPDSWLPQAIMDRLGDILADPQSSAVAATPILTAETPPDEVPSPTLSEARRPLLTSRRISSMVELQRFFTTVSLSAYEAIYQAGAEVDWDAVERSLQDDLFEGGAECMQL
ncbi:hypothetical protein JCM11641_006959 [Rhodosporidiobolus odoratus]